MKLSRLAILALIVLVIAAAAAGIVYFLNNRPLSVAVAQTEKDVVIEVFGLGTVEPRIMSKVGFELASTLIEVDADHGDRVKRGEVIARLDSAEQQAQTERARAVVQSSEAALARSETMVKRQAAVLAQKRAIDARQQELLRKGVSSIEQAEESAKDVSVAEADYALSMSDVDVARAALQTARADLGREETILRKYALTAPYDSVVVERHLEPGTAVKAGEPVFTLVDPASIWGLAYVEEARAEAIAEGQPARVRLRSLPGNELRAHVVRIGIESDRVSEERRVWVKCDQCPPTFHLGEQAEVYITTGTLAEALLVPAAAVSGFDGAKGTVWLADHGVARRAALDFASQTLDGRLAVTAPLPEGTSVIIGNPAGLREGRAVRIGQGAAP